MAIMNSKKEKGSGVFSKSPSSATQNWNEDEYAQVIEGVKKIYKSKIRPLEVTYNFEGNCNCSLDFFVYLIQVTIRLSFGSAHRL